MRSDATDDMPNDEEQQQPLVHPTVTNCQKLSSFINGMFCGLPINGDCSRRANPHPTLRNYEMYGIMAGMLCGAVLLVLILKLANINGGGGPSVSPSPEPPRPGF